MQYESEGSHATRAGIGLNSHEAAVTDAGCPQGVQRFAVWKS